MFLHEDDVFWSVMMNVAVPPFDDVHVRRAVARAIDRAALVELLSEPPYGPFGFSWGEVATHMAPGSRSRRARLTAARYHGLGMSEHTERLDDLSKRLASAKEFL